jgi:20S proteasome alpha/beta subunit
LTVIVAVKCLEGIVVGADGMATSSNGFQPTMQTASSSKIQIIGDRVIIAGTGEVGLGQRFHQIVNNGWNSKYFQKACMDCATMIAGDSVKNFQSSGTPMRQGSGYGFAAIMAGPFNKKNDLVEFGITNFQPERKNQPLHFVSVGSGQVLADPFLAFINRVIWCEKLPSLADGKLGVLWALRHAIKLAPGGVGDPIQMATLTEVAGQAQAKFVEPEEQQQFEQHVVALEEKISVAVSELFNAPAPPPPVLK